MGTGDKMRNKAEEAVGKSKQKTGEATNDPQLRDEGRGKQSKAKFKQAGENLKDAFRK